ncbi:MAG: FxLYD domain-containing protein, partial [Phycisphaerales bacterium]|nr:FxLYD domain-containing protein [Phycisphaerales bacterium]
LRQDLAECNLQATQANRELEELRQFMADHREYGDDFQKYKAVKEIAEREQRRLEAQANRERVQAEKAERQARLNAARAQKAQRDAQAAKVAQYRRAGFTPLGLDVYTSKMAYAYETTDSTRTRIEYDPFLGGSYYRTTTATNVDYSKMTISGSVLNASNQTRNVGVAITFFDENGNQVGHETIQINNARPEVPYPFTSTIEMALNRPFSSSSTYVLYADPVEENGGT